MHTWIDNYDEYKRPNNQLRQDLKKAYTDYHAIRPPLKTDSSTIEQCIHPRSSYLDNEHLSLPWLTSTNQSMKHSNLHFIGLDPRKPSLSLGIHGVVYWHVYMLLMS